MPPSTDTAESADIVATQHNHVLVVVPGMITVTGNDQAETSSRVGDPVPGCQRNAIPLLLGVILVSVTCGKVVGEDCRLVIQNYSIEPRSDVAVERAQAGSDVAVERSLCKKQPAGHERPVRGNDGAALAAEVPGEETKEVPRRLRIQVGDQRAYPDEVKLAAEINITEVKRRYQLGRVELRRAEVGPGLV